MFSLDSKNCFLLVSDKNGLYYFILTLLLSNHLKMYFDL